MNLTLRKIIILFQILSIICLNHKITFSQELNKGEIKSLTESIAEDTTILKVIEAINVIDKNYVDTINKDEIVEDAIRGILKKLDPHSVYLSKNELKRANEPLEGNFEGVGIQFNILNDTVIVIAAIAGGPSEKLGIRSGDKIIKVDDSVFVGEKITDSKVLKTLRGEKGTKVKVSIMRKGEKEILDFTITRDKIPIYSIDASYMAAPQTGYIKVNRFAGTTMNEYHKAIMELENKGLRNLILDLRGNSGGYLNIAINLADEFLDKGKLIVYTEGVASPRNEYNATSRGEMDKGKLVVLIDEGSASASEIVSGAIQDWDRGLIIGRRSFGKGLVQKPFPLPDGSAIRLTIARYYTPTGRCIQKPYEDDLDKYSQDLSNRYKHGELLHKDSIKFPDSLKFYTPNKRVVYGGGGIMPDIFIPIDTTQNSTYFFNLVRKGIIHSYALRYVDNNRATLKEQYPERAVFKEKFIVDDKFLDTFIDYAEKEGAEQNKKEFKTSKTIISNYLKAYIARNLWDFSAYFEIMNEMDPTFIKAVEVINDDTFDKERITY